MHPVPPIGPARADRAAGAATRRDDPRGEVRRDGISPEATTAAAGGSSASRTAAGSTTPSNASAARASVADSTAARKARPSVVIVPVVVMRPRFTNDARAISQSIADQPRLSRSKDSGISRIPRISGC